jgi:secreted PhoX family phosphatase
MPDFRRLLPIIGTAQRGHTARSAMTCQYRCGNACDHPVPNESDNEYLGDIISTGLTRRGLVRAGALGALVIGAAGTGLAGTGSPAVAGPDAEPEVPDADLLAAPAAASGALTFKPIPPNQLDALVVPNGYDSAVVIRWGDPVVAGAPAFNAYQQTWQAQLKQFGYNNDYLTVLPLDRRGDRALLVTNHEYTDEELMFPGFTSHDALDVEQVKVAMAAHGLSVVEIERVGDTGRWIPVSRGPRRYNRRITALETKFTVDGPAAGSPLLRTPADPAGKTVIGTLNNCSGGTTPWGTVLSGEENFNQYFVGGDTAKEPIRSALARYGIDITRRYPSGSRKWERADGRFDLATTPNEAHRFGWVVELDPYTPGSRPRKHTALGRIKHEGAATILAKDGRAVAYTGDDERFEYLYKFVSDKRMDRGRSSRARQHNLTLLESGTLYVAKFEYTSKSEIDGSGTLPTDGAFNGRGTWVPLVRGSRSQVPDMSVDEVLVFTRLAADKVGATKMDRPEDVEANPKTGKVYAVMTNNIQRGTAGKAAADEVNPRNVNKHGHIVEITEDGGDNGAESFTWDLLLVCGDPKDPSTYFAGYDKSKVSPISCPDNVAFDGAGNLWIATDGNQLGSNDGLFAVPLEGPERGHARQFLTVPYGAETCGPFVAADGRSVFVNVQHPGEIDGASLDKPASTWPDGDFAKPAVAVSWRRDGRPIGS